MAKAKGKTISKLKKDVKSMLDHPVKLVKSILHVGFLIGFIWMLVAFFKFLHGGLGQLVKELLGDAAQIANALGNALKGALNIANKCLGGKDNSGKSVSTGSQVGNCFGLIGIVLGLLVGVPLLGYLGKRLINRVRDGSEFAKEGQDKIIDAAQNNMEDWKSEMRDKLTESLVEKGMDEKEAESKATEITESAFRESFSKVIQRIQEDALKKTTNERDQQILDNAQNMAENESKRQTTMVDGIPVNEEDKKEIQNEVDDEQENMESQMNEAIDG